VERAVRPLLHSTPCCSAAHHGRHPEVLQRPTWGRGGRPASSDAPQPATALAMGGACVPAIGELRGHAAGLGCGRPSGSFTRRPGQRMRRRVSSTPAVLGAWVAAPALTARMAAVNRGRGEERGGGTVELPAAAASHADLRPRPRRSCRVPICPFE
jgi:hypothetical protein